MKKIIFIVAISLYNYLPGQTRIQTLELDNMGLLNTLVRIKVVTEQEMLIKIDLFKDEISNIQEDIGAYQKIDPQTSVSKDSILSKRKQIAGIKRLFYIASQPYLKLKEALDEIIIQLEGDIRQKNNLSVYKRINNKIMRAKQFSELNLKWYNSRRVKRYKHNLKIVDSFYNTFNLNWNRNHFTAHKTLDSTKLVDLNPVDYLNFIKDLYISIRDSNEKKVEKMCVMLDAIRLSSVNDLFESGGKKPEPKEDAKKDDETK